MLCVWLRGRPPEILQKSREWVWEGQKQPAACEARTAEPPAPRSHTTEAPTADQETHA